MCRCRTKGREQGPHLVCQARATGSHPRPSCACSPLASASRRSMAAQPYHVNIGVGVAAVEKMSVLPAFAPQARCFHMVQLSLVHHANQFEREICHEPKSAARRGADIGSFGTLCTVSGSCARWCQWRGEASRPSLHRCQLGPQLCLLRKSHLPGLRDSLLRDVLLDRLFLLFSPNPPFCSCGAASNCLETAFLTPLKMSESVPNTFPV